MSSPTEAWHINVHAFGRKAKYTPRQHNLIHDSCSKVDDLLAEDALYAAQANRIIVNAFCDDALHGRETLTGLIARARDSFAAPAATLRPYDRILIYGGRFASEQETALKSLLAMQTEVFDVRKLHDGKGRNIVHHDDLVVFCTRHLSHTHEREIKGECERTGAQVLHLPYQNPTILASYIR